MKNSIVTFYQCISEKFTAIPNLYLFYMNQKEIFSLAKFLFIIYKPSEICEQLQNEMTIKFNQIEYKLVLALLQKRYNIFDNKSLNAR